MKGIINLAKKYFLAQMQIVCSFHYFCKVRACRISVKNSVKNSIFKNCGETLLLVKGIINLAKKYFFSTNADSM